MRQPSPLERGATIVARYVNLRIESWQPPRYFIVLSSYFYFVVLSSYFLLLLASGSEARVESERRHGEGTL